MGILRTVLTAFSTALLLLTSSCKYSEPMQAWHEIEIKETSCIKQNGKWIPKSSSFDSLRFRVSFETQTVVSLSTFSRAYRWHNCLVFDRNNWTCANDGSIDQVVIDGKFQMSCGLTKSLPGTEAVCNYVQPTWIDRFTFTSPAQLCNRLTNEMNLAVTH